MANEAERAWRTFKQYGVTGIQVEEAPDYIAFSQVNHVRAKPRNRLAVILCAIWAVASMFSLAVNPAFGLFVAFALGIVLPVIWFVSVLTMMRARTYLKLFADHIAVQDSNGSLDIKYDEVQNIDVRRDNVGNHQVVLWYGPKPMALFDLHSETEAISLREGIMAASGVMTGGMGEVVPVDMPARQPVAPQTAPAPSPRAVPNPFPE